MFIPSRGNRKIDYRVYRDNDGVLMAQAVSAQGCFECGTAEPIEAHFALTGTPYWEYAARP